MDKTYIKILRELDWPPIYMIPNEQFLHVEGGTVGSDFGISSDKQPVFVIAKGLRGKVKENVLYHEIGHLLFPHRPHWWIECFAEKMARGGGRGDYSKKYGHTVDELPSRAVLLKLSRRASKRMKKKL